jgi:prolyl-tRNA editing enzyme YbaK/EbsC (Cys-tRNA(Pro) deacylase)
MSKAPPSFPHLDPLPPLEHPELLAAATLAALERWFREVPDAAQVVGVCAIDPALSDTAALTEGLGLPPDASINCVVVAGKRAGIERIAGAGVRANTRADVNNTIRRLLDVRKASFMPVGSAVAATGMEYGGITPIGLPEGWRILFDRQVIDGGAAVIGAGVRQAKLVLPGSILATLPGAEVIDGLSIPSSEPGTTVPETR